MRCHSLGDREFDALLLPGIALEDTAVATDDQTKEQHASEVAKEGDHPGLGNVKKAGASMEECDGQKLYVSCQPRDREWEGISLQRTITLLV